MVGPPPVASSTAGAETNRNVPVRMSIVSTPDSAPSFAGTNATARCSSRRRIGRAHTCSISRLMISMPVRSPLCTVRSKVWPAKALPCSVPSGLRSKKQPISFSSSLHALDRSAHQRPRQFLVRQPLAALDGVHEVALDQVALVQRDVVAALHHAGAPAFPHQALADDRDVEIRIGAMGMQRREQPGTARAEDQDVGFETFEGHEILRTYAARNTKATTADMPAAMVASCFCPSLQSRFSITSSRTPPNI